MISLFYAAAAAMAGPEIFPIETSLESNPDPVPTSAVSLSKAMRRDWVRDVVVHPPDGRAALRARDANLRRVARRAHKAAIRTDWSGCATWKNGKLIRRFTPVAATS